MMHTVLIAAVHEAFVESKKPNMLNHVSNKKRKTDHIC